MRMVAILDMSGAEAVSRNKNVYLFRIAGLDGV